jgi:site-specific DNA recombinase
MTRPAAIYARVSSDRQKENHTICSQLAALEEYAGSHGYLVPPEWRFQDEGYSGATLLRPGLEALRDLAAGGHIAAVLVYCPAAAWNWSSGKRLPAPRLKISCWCSSRA